METIDPIYATLISTIGTVISGLIMLRVRQVQSEVKTVKHEMNSRLTQLLDVAKALARQEGIDEGRALQRKDNQKE